MMIFDICQISKKEFNIDDFVIIKNTPPPLSTITELELPYVFCKKHYMKFDYNV
jgi:hypothetical protein